MFSGKKEEMLMHRPWFVGIGLRLLLIAVPCDAWLASAEPRMTVYEAWGPPMPPVASTGAFYMVIHNAGNETERLRGAYSPACTSIEFHETYQKLGGTMGMGAMSMRPVPGGVIDIPAQSQVELKASGLHFMCLGKRIAFAKYAQLPLTLHFEASGEITVPVLIHEP
jgi:copper(I)-binding protein